MFLFSLKNSKFYFHIGILKVGGTYQKWNTIPLLNWPYYIYGRFNLLFSYLHTTICLLNANTDMFIHNLSCFAFMLTVHVINYQSVMSTDIILRRPKGNHMQSLWRITDWKWSKKDILLCNSWNIKRYVSDIVFFIICPCVYQIFSSSFL